MRKFIPKNKRDIDVLINSLQRAYPKAKCSLLFKNPLQLLVATILSAQCTDKRVNMVTPALFKKYPDAVAFANADIDELMGLIRSIGFYRNKSKNIKACCRKIVDEFEGTVPSSMANLITLPGVARKTANVVLFNGFGKNEGIAVDTHVTRIALRLGLTENTNPIKIERDLLNTIPSDYWGVFTHWMIDWGRDVCKAPKPNCKECTLQKSCNWFKKNQS